VPEHLFELSIGQTLQVGQYKVTLLDVEGEELCVQIDGADDGDIPEDIGLENLLSLDELFELEVC